MTCAIVVIFVPISFFCSSQVRAGAIAVKGAEESYRLALKWRGAANIIRRKFRAARSRWAILRLIMQARPPLSRC